MADPYFASVSLLVGNENGADGTKTFIDQSNNAFVITPATANAVWTNSGPPTGLTTSISEPNIGDYLSTPAGGNAVFDFGAGDYTIEAYINLADVAVQHQVCTQWGATPAWIVTINPADLTHFYRVGAATKGPVEGGVLVGGTWYHIAVCRNGADLRTFVDGAQVGATFNAGTDTLNASTNPVQIGANGGTQGFKGKIAAVRITKGVARYTTTFTPPTLPLPTTAVDAPVADFSGTPLTGTAPLSVAFTDLSTNTPTSWAWTFGDTDTDTVQNPTHIYAAAGTYDVGLTATNAAGNDLETKTGYVTVSAAAATATTAPSGGKNPSQGYTGYETRTRSAEDVRRERQKLGILPPDAEKVIASVAAQQAKRLEQDEQKRFEELSRELELRGIEWDARYLESLNFERERLINAEIALRLRQRLKDEEELMLLVLMVAVA